jgi:hypothetical protein
MKNKLLLKTLTLASTALLLTGPIQAATIVDTTDEPAWYTGSTREEGNIGITVFDDGGANGFTGTSDGPDSTIGASGWQIEIAAFPDRIIRPNFADDGLGLRFKDNINQIGFVQDGDDLSGLYSQSAGGLVLEKDGVPQGGLVAGSNWIFITGVNSNQYPEYGTVLEPVTSIAMEVVWNDVGTTGTIDPGDTFSFGNLRYLTDGGEFAEWAGGKPTVIPEPSASAALIGISMALLVGTSRMSRR